jgi:hypothetical protein
MIRTRTIKYWNFTAHFHWMELGVWREKWAVHFTVSTLIMPKDIKKEKTDWTNARKSMFIEIMLEQVRAGENCDSNGFKSKLWLEIMKGFNMTAEVDYDKQQLQSQYSIMKKQYLIFRTLYDKSGFDWDDENKVPTAPDTVWDEYFEHHPEAAKYRHETLPHFEDLCEIFSGKCAAGRFAEGTTQEAEMSATKRFRTAVDLTDESGCGSDEGGDGDVNPRPLKTGTPGCLPSTPGLPPSGKTPRKSPANARAVEILELLVNKISPVTRALELFSKECAPGLTMAYRLAIKTALSLPHSAELFLCFDADEERSAWVADFIRSTAPSAALGTTAAVAAPAAEEQL